MNLTGRAVLTWRVRMTDGRTADVEVTTNIDEPMASFFGALHERDGSPRVWPDERLSYRWAVLVVDGSPAANKARRPFGRLLEELTPLLAQMEATCVTPEQMQHHAQAAIDGCLRVSRTAADLITVTDLPGLQIDDGEHSQRLRIAGAPERAVSGDGAIELVPMGAPQSCSGCGELVAALRRCIDAKTRKRQLDGAPDLKWLAVVLDGSAGWQLKHYFGGESRMLPPKLDGVLFDYFDEVWAIRATTFKPGEDVFVVLRLSGGGTMQRHCVVVRR